MAILLSKNSLYKWFYLLFINFYISFRDKNISWIMWFCKKLLSLLNVKLALKFLSKFCYYLTHGRRQQDTKGCLYPSAHSKIIFFTDRLRVTFASNGPTYKISIIFWPVRFFLPQTTWKSFNIKIAKAKA